MILDPVHRIAFVHVPKCAGTTIRNWLRPALGCDNSWAGPSRHPAFGPYHRAHVPLEVLRDHFPQAYDDLRACRAFALCRAPGPRFQSALAQHLREFHDCSLTQMSPEARAQAARRVIDRLTSDKAYDYLEMVHFLKQSDFIECQGARVVGEVFAIERLSEAIEAIAGATGLETRPPQEKANETRQIRLPSAAPLMRRGRKLAEAVLPQQAFRAVHGRAFRMLTRAQTAERPDTGLPDDVLEFVNRHYRRDHEIHAAALEPRPAPVS
ncbi:MAG: hypothetical protein AAGF79_09675 [Pseudomonadota bacterium]